MTIVLEKSIPYFPSKRGELDSFFLLRISCYNNITKAFDLINLDLTRDENKLIKSN